MDFIINLTADLMFPNPLSASLLAAAEGGSVFADAAILLVVLAAPFVLFTFVIHFLERAIQRRLAGRFGWKSVLWTGWLGTPVHELSHALLCILFRHKIKDMALFEPDSKSGRLGYVEHTFIRGNWFQELGNVFIGLAPLAGGSFVLAVLLWMFYPEAAKAALDSARAANETSESAVAAAFGLIGDSAAGVCGEILNWKNFFSVRFWAFIYLVLCVGSHMAPSASDYRGATRGVFLLLAIVVGGVLITSAVYPDVRVAIGNLIAGMSPLFALFALTAMLCSIATVIVFLLTSFFPLRYRLG